MKSLLQKASTTLILCGTISFWFGLFVFIWPDVTLMTLVWLFAISIIVQGVLHIVAAMKYRKEEYHWWVLLFLSLIHIAGGLFALFYPDITTTFLFAVMGGTWLAAGTLQIIAAIWLRKEIRTEGVLIITGVISVLAGIFMMTSPQESAMALIWLIAVYAGLFGILMIVFGIKAKLWGGHYIEDIMQ